MVFSEFPTRRLESLYSIGPFGDFVVDPKTLADSDHLGVLGTPRDVTQDQERYLSSDLTFEHESLGRTWHRPSTTATSRDPVRYTSMVCGVSKPL